MCEFGRGNYRYSIRKFNPNTKRWKKVGEVWADGIESAKRKVSNRKFSGELKVTSGF